MGRGGGANVGGGAGVAGPPGMGPTRIKPEGSGMWGHAAVGGRNGAWDDIGAGGSTGVGGGPGAAWDDGTSWTKQKMPGPLWAAGDNELDWGHKQTGKLPLTKEMVWNSKQFRALVDMGHKVRNSNISI